METFITVFHKPKGDIKVTLSTMTPHGGQRHRSTKLIYNCFCSVILNSLPQG